MIDARKDAAATGGARSPMTADEIAYLLAGRADGAESIAKALAYFAMEEPPGLNEWQRQRRRLIAFELLGRVASKWVLAAGAGPTAPLA